MGEGDQEMPWVVVMRKLREKSPKSTPHPHPRPRESRIWFVAEPEAERRQREETGGLVRKETGTNENESVHG